MNKYHILDKIWKSQKEFNRNFVDFENLTTDLQQSFTKEYSLHLISEVNDLLSSINWKIHHKMNSIPINRQEVILEWIDIFKYWLSIGLLWGISPEEFVNNYEEKSSLVEQRYLQEFNDRLGQGKGIAIVDIDGVLGDYPLNFLRYVDINEGTHFSEEEISDINLYQFFSRQIPEETLKEYKHCYRRDGLSRNEAVSEGAKEFLKKLKSAGYYIVLLTSRPFDKYKNLYLDTLMWLRYNNLEFDMLLNDSKKRDKIVKIATSSHSTIKFIVDDDPRIISGFLGYEGLNKIYMMDKPYNREFGDGDTRITRVHNFEEILEEEGVV